MNHIRWTILCVILVAGSFWLGTRFVPKPAATDAAAPAAETIYTCSMHPQVRLPNPGDCPICAMPLIPVNSVMSSGSGDTLEFSDHMLHMAGVEAALVERRPLEAQARAYGRVDYDERKLATITARFGGYVEKLHVDFTGAEVRQGDAIVEVFSPELSVALKELSLAAAGTHTGLLNASKAKLVNLGLTQTQVDELLATPGVSQTVTLKTPLSGTVVEKMAVEKTSFMPGEALYRIANLDTVWLVLDVFERDAGTVATGQVVDVTTEAYPGRTFSGTVSFISPVLNTDTRTFQVRAEIANTERALKPGMYVSALLKRPLAPAAPATGDLYICTMCPEIQATQPGDCSKCGMALVKAPAVATAAGVLSVPVTAVLDSGTRKLVYVETGKGVYQPVEVQTGPRAGDYLPILSGLHDGQRVAVRGAFLLDSQYQVSGMSSLFYTPTNAATTNVTH